MCNLLVIIAFPYSGGLPLEGSGRLGTYRETLTEVGNMQK